MKPLFQEMVGEGNKFSRPNTIEEIAEVVDHVRNGWKVQYWCRRDWGWKESSITKANPRFDFANESYRTIP